MLALDVSVLVSALWEDSTAHAEVGPWLEAQVNGIESVGASHAVLTGVVRILTHPRIFETPATTDEAITTVRQVVSDGVEVLSPGPGYLDIFERICRETGARGNLVADAAHAATAIAHDATFITMDRDFARFPGLRWRSPG